MGIEPWSPALQVDSLPPELPGKPSVGEVDQAQEVVYSRHRRVGYETKRHPGTIITIKSGLSKCSPIHRRRQWHPTPVLLPGKSHGWRSLVGCSPWGCLESDTTEQLHFHVLEKEMATHSSVLAWRIPGTGSLVGCCLWGGTESDTTEMT